MFDAFGWELYRVNGYLYATIGIFVCYGVGYLASCVLPARPIELTGLTLWDPVDGSGGEPAKGEKLD